MRCCGRALALFVVRSIASAMRTKSVGGKFKIVECWIFALVSTSDVRFEGKGMDAGMWVTPHDMLVMLAGHLLDTSLHGIIPLSDTSFK